MKRTFILTCLLVAILGIKSVKADHCAGGELVYRWLADSTYEFTFKFYRDCSGIPAPPLVSLCVMNSCGYSIPVITLNRPPVLPDGTPNGSKIYSGCAGYPGACDSPPGPLPGYEEYWYTGTIVLPRCSSWTIGVSINARNTSVNILSAGTAFYVETKLNNMLSFRNSSPNFTVKPVPYVCINNPYTFNNGVQDADGDSLTYELLQPLKSTCNGTTTVVPFSSANYNIVNNPIPCNNTFVLNPASGQMSFTSSATGPATLTLKVNEYRNGVNIGSIMRDIQVRSLALCSPVQPLVSLDTNGITGASLVNGRLEQCANRPMTFCFRASSPNTTAVLIARDNASLVAPGAIITYSGQYSNSVTGCLSWTPGPADTGLRSFTVIVKDSTCGPPGIAISQTYLIPIYIHSATVAIRDTSICLGQSVQLDAIGGQNFSWSVLPGGAPLSSLSCINCQQPVISPTVTTRYVVTSDLISFCNTNRDTIQVTVSPVPAPPVITSNSPVCMGDTIILSTGSLAGHYSWTGPAGFHDTLRTVLIQNASPANTGTYQLVLRNGVCLSQPAMVNITVVGVAATPVVTGDSMLCYGETIQLTAASDPGTIYNWTGPDGFTGNTAAIQISNATPQQSGLYKVIARYPSGINCTSQETAYQVTVNPEIITDFDISRGHICQHDTITVLFKGTNRASINYRYNFGYGSSIVAGAGTDPHIVRYTMDGGNQIWLYAEENGCVDSVKKDLYVEKAPSSDFHVQPDACIDEAIWLNSSEFVSFDLEYNWDFDGARINYGTGKGPYSITYNTSGYKVIRFAAKGETCPSLLTTDTVYVHPVPEASIISVSKQDICAGDMVAFEALPNPAYIFEWSPRLSFDVMEARTLGEITESGYVVLTVKDSYGCSNTDSTELHTRPCCEVYMPTAFTPNKDGKNDVFKLVTIGNPLATELRVVNRWGQTVFTSGSKDIGWDGTYNGKDMDSDTYFYYLRYKCATGKYYEVKGDIILVR